MNKHFVMLRSFDPEVLEKNMNKFYADAPKGYKLIKLLGVGSDKAIEYSAWYEYVS